MIEDEANSSELSHVGAAKSVLLLCDRQPDGAATVLEHIDSISRYSDHKVFVYSGIGELPAEIDLDRFDVVIVHYSIFIGSDTYLGPITRYRLRGFEGLKMVFLHDEYRNVDATVRALEYLRIDVLFTVVPTEEIRKVYPKEKLPTLNCVNILTGYVSEDWLAYEPSPLNKRKIDVGYRGRKYPAWHGQLGLEKWMIAERFLEDAVSTGLKCDISWREADRIYGEDWIRFLGESKAQLGVESGASVFDFSGEISKRVEDHEALKPDTPYEELRRLYFSEEEGKIRLNQISPRIFEAAAMKCVLVLYEGEYSGVIFPNRHFIPLKKDHSNMSEVIEKLRDIESCQNMVDRVYRDVVLNADYQYPGMVKRVDVAIDAYWQGKKAAAEPYDRLAFEGDMTAARVARKYTVVTVPWFGDEAPKIYLPLRRDLPKPFQSLARIHHEIVAPLLPKSVRQGYLIWVRRSWRAILSSFKYLGHLLLRLHKGFRAGVQETAISYRLRFDPQISRLNGGVGDIGHQELRKEIGTVVSVQRIAKQLSNRVGANVMDFEFRPEEQLIVWRIADRPVPPWTKFRFEESVSDAQYNELVWAADTLGEWAEKIVGPQEWGTRPCRLPVLGGMLSTMSSELATLLAGSGDEQV